jgi:hypothetical protein
VVELRRLHSSRGGSRFFLILSFLVVERDFFAPDPVVDAKLVLSASPLLLLLLLLLLLCMQAWPVVEGLQLEVTGRTTKCIVDEIQSDVLVIDDYKVVSTSQDDLSVTAKVRILSVSFALLVFCLFFGSLSMCLCCGFFFSPCK